MTDPTTIDTAATPISLSDRLMALRQRVGLSEVYLFRITSGRNGQRMQRLLRFPDDVASRPLGQDFRAAVRMVSETATPLMTIRRERRRDDEAPTAGGKPSAVLIAPISTMDDTIWGTLVGVSPADMASGDAFRAVMQTAAQIGGEVSSWGRPQAPDGPDGSGSSNGATPTQANQVFSMTSTAALLHELRSPLAASDFALDILERGHVASDDEAGQDALRTLRLALAEAVHITRWWEEARSRGKIEAHIQPVSLEEALRQSITLITRAASRIHLNIGSDTPLALADTLMLNRVFLNLIENAIIHGEPGGAVEISTQAAGNRVQTRFLNEGLMSDDSAGHMFRPASAGSARNGALGHGYGLGIVRALLNTMGGSLEVDSDAQRWTAFTVWLPAVRTQRDATSE
ncbi:MAG TPA: HAMP domain-containing sensor histidine kinase [Ktedonobacterales bacterium]